jgi:hypothetical protein
VVGTQIGDGLTPQEKFSAIDLGDAKRAACFVLTGM